MNHVFRNSNRVRQTIMRDAHDPYRVAVKTETNEADGNASSARIRSAELLKQDSPNPLRDGEVIAFAFQFPTVMDFMQFKRKEPELFAAVHSDNDTIRLRAAEQMSILYPQYVTTTRRGDSRRRTQ